MTPTLAPTLATDIRARIEDDVGAYYTSRIEAHGAVAAGADWRDEESQTTRFVQLASLIADPTGSVVDLGCGYGAFARFLRARGHAGPYVGLDLSPAMIGAAEQFTRGLPGIRFACGSRPAEAADYVVASGIFNVRGAVDLPSWEAYVAATLAEMDRFARRGFAYNCLSLCSDPEKRRPDLYYADPLAAFARWKCDPQARVALLHDYGLYEFTLIVRK